MIVMRWSWAKSSLYFCNPGRKPFGNCS
jgi:hypothetical protein